MANTASVCKQIEIDCTYDTETSKNTKYLLHTCIILLETNIWKVEQEAKIIH